LLAHIPIELALEPDKGFVRVQLLLECAKGTSISWANAGSWASTAGSAISTSSGMAQMLAAGTLEAKISPLRSKMRPRLAASSIVRAKRTSPWRRKKSLPINCT